MFIRVVLYYLHIGQIHLPLNKTLMDDTSVKWSIVKTFLFFIRFLMKLGEVVVNLVKLKVVVPMCLVKW